MSISHVKNVKSVPQQMAYMQGVLKDKAIKTSEGDPKIAKASLQKNTSKVPSPNVDHTQKPSLSGRSSASSKISDISYSQIGEALNELPNTETLIYEALIEIFKSALQEYNHDREDVIKSANASYENRLNEAEEIKEEGYALMAGGMLNALGQTGAGLAGFAGSAAGGESSDATWGNMNKGQGIGQILGGIGTATKDSTDLVEKSSESRAKLDDAAASKESTYGEATKSLFEEEKQLQADVLQSLSQIEQSQHDTASQVISKV